ncbi:SUMF1/EgtB/PvdO family nonheme iron enzyme [Planctomycetota bacterium]
MKKILVMMVVVVLVGNIASATIDTFGTGSNQFTIEFVDISGDASSENGTNISGWDPGDGGYRTFIDPINDYRMGTYEITNDQWDKFKLAYGTVTGNPSSAYDSSTYWAGTNVPTNNISWYEGLQFVNYLNTSTGHQAAYKFTGTQGQSDYTFVPWEAGDVGYNADNPFRNSNAYYFLPTEDEWVKAAYWNGTSLQFYSNASAGDIVSGTPDTTKWNYNPSTGYEPWNVGSGAKELNGTFDMMGNVWELLESPYYSGDYLSDSWRGIRGDSYVGTQLGLTNRSSFNRPLDVSINTGFRIASVPEPTTISLLAVGAMAMLRKRK